MRRITAPPFHSSLPVDVVPQHHANVVVDRLQLVLGIVAFVAVRPFVVRFGVAIAVAFQIVGGRV
jgi:hypothetical protein